jgi:hypothetical protein
MRTSNLISLQIDNAERKNVRTQSRPAADYEDALDMYADDFGEKEKARIEQQVEKKKNQGEEAAGVSSVASGESENGSTAGNGIVSSGQGESQGKYYSICILCLHW